MTIHLPEGREPFVRALVAGGRFASESDVVDEALGLLEERERRRVEVPERSGLEIAVSDHFHDALHGVEAREAVKRQAEPTPRPIWEVIQEISATVPDEAWDGVPTDLAAQHDHYLYGTPKRTDS